MKKITKEQARNYLVCYHNLDGQRGYKGEKGTLEYFKQVGSVQFDPLKVAGRNADLALQSSVGGYTPAVMEKLLYSDRKLVDGWDKMQSVHMQDDWACFSYTRKNQKENYIRWLKRIGSSEILDYVVEIRKMLEENGPLPSTKIDFGGRLDTGWGRGKASAITLDYMLKTGEIGVRNKLNAVKVYDLSERLISEENYEKENPFKTEAEFTDWLTLRRIGSIGLLWIRNGGGWLGSRYLENRKNRTDALKRLLEKELIEEIAVDGLNDVFYIRKTDEVFLDAVARNSAKIIAPLDNMIWDRLMTKTLFDFEYSWEVYVPKTKRKYGYYVLPVLCGDKFIARFEPEYNRAGQPLKILNWWNESVLTAKEKRAVSAAFDGFCDYLGCGGSNISDFI